MKLKFNKTFAFWNNFVHLCSLKNTSSCEITKMYY